MPEITLPTMHAGQLAAWNARTKLYPIRCGRRWGKTQLFEIIACDRAAKGLNVGWFTPDYKIQAEAFHEIENYLDPVWRQSSRVEGVYRTISGGRLDFWTLENERAGRSRKYHLVIIDEAAFTKPNMRDIWERAISPALWDYQGTAIVGSTPNGVNEENFFYQVCTNPELGFVRKGEDGKIVGDFRAPSWTNPHVPSRRPGETQEQWQQRADAHWAKVKADSHPLVFRQETEAEFVDWRGVAFFSADRWMGNDGLPVPYPERCDVTFATMDTAIKAGSDNDGTAVVYWAANYRAGMGDPLTILDWDLVQIEGASLETWLPSVYERLKTLTLGCGSRRGSLGAFIEDKGSGTILLQQAKKRGWPAVGIDNKLTALGKDERALSVSGYHHQGKVKITQAAYDKLVKYKGAEENHFLLQVTGFRLGDKDSARRSDDLLDAYTYGLSLALGNFEGY